MRLPAFLAGVGLAAQTAMAVPPVLTVTTIQPSSAPSVPDEDYEPAAPAAFVFHEPTAYPTLPAFGHRVTVDLTVRNDEPDYIRLNEYDTNIGAWNADLVDQELLAIPDTLLEFPFDPPDNRRPALTNGGFAVSGLKIEQDVLDDDDVESLTFGEALDVLAYDLDEGEGYLVAGSFQYISHVPDSLDDSPPLLTRQGFIAKYDVAGAMRTRLTTEGEEVSAIADLGNGLYLLAGRYKVHGGHKELLLRRVRSWETVDGDSTDLEILDPDSDYGADKESDRTLVPFYDGGKPCEVERAVDATVADKGNYHIVAVELRCSTGPRIGVSVTLANGTPLQSFGSGGSKVYAGPSLVPAIPVGVETQVLTRSLVLPGAPKEHWAWLGAAVGPECNPVDDACSFGLTRIDYITGAMHKSGWYTPAEQSFWNGARPRDMALDTSGRPVMAGVVELLSDNHYVAVHRFRTDGTSDAGFGVAGWSMQSFNGHDGEAYAVRPRRNGEIALAILSELDTPAGLDWSMAMMNLSATGTPTWQHDPYESDDDPFTHMSVRTDLNYGYRYETKVSSLPWAITEDWRDRLVMVGFGGSDYLRNPCEAMAEELNEPRLNYSVACGGPWSVALARYLPFGQPDSRRWLAPNESRSMVVPSDVHFGVMPSFMNIALNFDGFTSYGIARAMVPFQNAIADAETNSYGAYRFPFDTWILSLDERFRVKAHPLDHHHRNSSGNRFAYDISVVRWSGAEWVETTDDGATGNEGQLMWGRGVRAVAGGKVVACRRSAPDNAPSAIESKDANFVKIQHTFDPFDRTRAEFISYLHFKQDSVPTDVCPNICPAEDPGCDPETEGADPNGAELPTPVDVIAGQFIGSAGNSGNSTSPHLHVHMSTAESDTGSYPLLFHEVTLQSADDGPDGPQWPVDNAAILHGSLAFPTD